MVYNVNTMMCTFCQRLVTSTLKVGRHQACITCYARVKGLTLPPKVAVNVG